MTRIVLMISHETQKLLQKKHLLHLDSHMFHNLSINSRYFSCTEDPCIYISVSWGGEEGEFPCFLSVLPTVCGTKTLADSSNYYYCFSNLQGLQSIVGLSETESLSVAWGLLKYIKKRRVCSTGLGRSVHEGWMQVPSL